MAASSPVTKCPVVVTGATGFIAAHVVNLLLKRGYKVRGTVRNLEDNLCSCLREFENASTNLELVIADLLKAEGWANVVDGCEYVLHVASPVIRTFTDSQKELVDPAVQGTTNVFNACRDSTSVKKVVLTSSVSAIAGDWENGRVYTEADWNDTSSLDYLPYAYGKTMAERAATKIHQDSPSEFSLAVLHPSIVLGPQFGTRVAESVARVKELMQNAFLALPPFPLACVDVRDVAMAHLLAMERKDWEGRTILNNQMSSVRDFACRLSKLYPNHGVRTLNCPGWLAQIPMWFRGERMASQMLANRAPTSGVEFDHSRSLQLGVTYRDLDVSLRDTVDSFIERGFIPKK